MANLTSGPVRTFKTNADLSAKRYFIVKMTAAEEVGLASAATDKIVGVVDNIPDDATGAAVAVRMRHGGSSLKVKLGGTVSRGDAVAADSAGKGVATTTAGDQVLGLALQAGVSGDVIELTPATHKY